MRMEIHSRSTQARLSIHTWKVSFSTQIFEQRKAFNVFIWMRNSISDLNWLVQSRRVPIETYQMNSIAIQRWLWTSSGLRFNLDSWANLNKLLLSMLNRGEDESSRRIQVNICDEFPRSLLKKRLSSTNQVSLNSRRLCCCF